MYDDDDIPNVRKRVRCTGCNRLVSLNPSETSLCNGCRLKERTIYEHQLLKPHLKDAKSIPATDLSSELQLTRAILSHKLTTATDDLTLAAMTPGLSQLVGQIAVLSKTHQDLSVVAGRTLPIERVTALINEICRIVQEEVPDNPELLSRLSERFSRLTLGLTSEEDSASDQLPSDVPRLTVEHGEPESCF